LISIVKPFQHYPFLSVLPDVRIYLGCLATGMSEKHLHISQSTCLKRLGSAGMAQKVCIHPLRYPCSLRSLL